MLVGREHELRRIEQLLALARTGRSRTLVLLGEPGIGKSELLEHAASRACDFQISRACGVESEAELPFAGLFDVCRPFLGVLDRLDPSQRNALRNAFGAEEAQAPTPFALGAATLSLLAAAAEEQPLLVLVDDVHWLDRGSADALAFAARRLAADAVACLFAARLGEGVGFADRDLPALALEGLDEASAKLLLERAAGAPLAPAARTAILATAAGNPLALLELPRHALAHADSSKPLPLGTRLERTFSAQLRALPDASRRALLPAAASGALEVDLLAAVLRRLDLDLASLEPAEAARLVVLDAGVVRFRHPLVRSAVYHAADPADRRRAHAALASVFGDDERGAWHLAAAATGADEAAARALEQAAEIAGRRSGFAAASAAYERAARLSESRVDRARRLTAAADAAWLGGETARALPLLEHALEETDDVQVQGELLHLRGTIEHFVGNARHAQRTLEQAAELLAPADPRLACLSLTEAVGSALLTGEADRAVALGEQALAIADAKQLDERLFASVPAGASLLLAGHPERALPLLKQAGHAARSDALEDDPRNLTWAALAGLFLCDTPMMVRKAAGAVEWARAHAAPAALPWAGMLLGVGLIAGGRWREARATLAEAAEAARLTSQEAHLVMALSPLAWLDAAEGRADECHSRTEEGLAIAERLALVWFRKWLLHARVMLELGAGPAGEASAVDELRRELLEQPLRDPPTAPLASWPELIEALVRLGRLEDADELLERHADDAERFGEPLPLALVERLRGLRADNGFENHFKRALALHANAENEFEAARTRLAYGECLRRSGRRVDARENLHASLAAFERVGAAPWAERARAELRGTGQRLRARGAASRDELTPQETQIMLVVGEGKTNREAGAQLFLSPRTVEWHLGRIYRKLGVRSRAELVRMVARGAAESAPPPEPGVSPAQ